MQQELKCNCGRLWGMDDSALVQRSVDREHVYCTCGRTITAWRGARDYPRLIQDLPNANICQCGCDRPVNGLYSRFLPGHDPALAKTQA